jgi:hypothetical protein
MTITEGGIKAGFMHDFNRQINCCNGFVKLGYFNEGQPWGKYAYFNNKSEVIADGIWDGDKNRVKQEVIKNYIENKPPYEVKKETGEEDKIKKRFEDFHKERRSIVK